MFEEGSSKKAVLPEDDKDKLVIVRDDLLTIKTYDRMLKLLDEDYEVVEELSGEIFLMRKRANKTSNDMYVRLKR